MESANEDQHNEKHDREHLRLSSLLTYLKRIKEDSSRMFCLNHKLKGLWHNACWEVCWYNCFPVVLVLASRLPLAVWLPASNSQQLDEESLISGLWTIRVKQLVVLISSSSHRLIGTCFIIWDFLHDCCFTVYFRLDRLVDKLAGVGWQTVSRQISGLLEFSPVVNPALVLLLSVVLFWDDNSLIFRLKAKTKSSLSSAQTESGALFTLHNSAPCSGWCRQSE